MVMKKHISILTIAAAAFLCSCSLEEVPSSFVNGQNFYENATQSDAALRGCYMPLANIYRADFMFVTESCTDIWYSGSSTKDAILEVTPAKPQYGATVWRQGYLGVVRCNECIDCINAAKYPDEQRMPQQAEARVMRAMYYYILTCMFNGVPFYTNRIVTDEELLEVRNLPRTDASAIREALYADLRDNALPYFTEKNGLKTTPDKVDGNRAGYALCLMLMAKMAMWNEDWDGALLPLKQLEELYGDLTEANYPLENTMWRYRNTPESIFEIQHDWSLTGVQYAGNVAAIMQPSHTVVDSSATKKVYLYDGIEMPELGTECTSWSSLKACNIYGIFRPAQGTTKTEATADQYRNSLFDPLPLTYDDEYSSADGRYYTKLDLEAIKRGTIRDKKIDRRVYLTFGLGNLETGATFTTARRYGVAWAGPKFWCPGMVLANDSNNVKVFRYADAILMMAECYCNLQNSDEAMRYLNMTRERAGVDPIDNFVGYEALMVNIRSERARELGGEFQRKFDLVRWGIWYEQTLGNNQSSNLKQRIKPCHRYYPIPETQCSLSNGHLTNDEYYADGL